ncbi:MULTISPECIES: DNA repair protein RadA [Lactobacillus]|uniref:DNA repair protein RadA n=1 Tax=Lactobacillus TaxID=1578 RepID=UPI000CDB154E|nr:MULTISPECIES: DNA repair protein RadA [Lactobacillus]MCO6532304.1 DNA repair protein RadA [Lactobacillus sp.]MCO6536258.1 DNA repair protein RadA [Lactobacillus sp.]MCT6820880.1 DNA repair protein RadA [Lactobacillus panisapium]MCT6854416.1 DNA repair protein RadA [Lactobacillus panisapium]MCT6865869.1 DNA repair protein RadA [Lactobacillus panisapium]
MAKIKTKYKCHSCGYISASYLGRCPNCGAWNQFEKETETVQARSTKGSPSRLIKKTGINEPVKITAVKAEKEERIKTSMGELNRVLGGGIVPGSLVLIGGDPGIGKSTLMLQIMSELSATYRVLYVSGEESANQIKLRADRLGLSGNEMMLYPETDMEDIRQQIDTIKPDFVVIDSIQTMNEPSLDSMTGSASQVREVTSELMKIAKMDAITVFVIGHVTKEGAIAGPKILEHMVDTVLYFEGDEHHAYRILHSVKNRFGAANEIGMFEMVNKGLQEVTNPSAIFLDERLPNSTGSAIVVSLEGTRPILAEIQALVTPTAFGYAKRTTSGIDFNRAGLLLAVLEKRGNLMLQNQDVYLTATGGIRLNEPAVDLAVVMAIASSYKNEEILPTDCFVGEVGLTGEVRRVNQIDARIKEAAKTGFKRIFIPKHNMRASLQNLGIEVIPVASIPQALKLVLG